MPSLTGKCLVLAGQQLLRGSRRGHTRSEPHRHCSNGPFPHQDALPCLPFMAFPSRHASPDRPALGYVARALAFVVEPVFAPVV